MAVSPVEALIACLYVVERDRISQQYVLTYMTAAGFSRDEIDTAWSDAARLGLTRDSGIGRRLSSVGRAEAPKLAAELDRHWHSENPDPPTEGDN